LSLIKSEAFIQHAKDYIARVNRALSSIVDEALIDFIESLILQRGTVYVVGNGGSASNSSHLALHLSDVNIRAIDVMSQVPTTTAFSNDLSYADALSSYLNTMAWPASDALVVISGSGNSENILNALKYARSSSIETFGLLGFGGGSAADLCDHKIVVASDQYGPVEDVHSAVIHMLTETMLQIPRPG